MNSQIVSSIFLIGRFIIGVTPMVVLWYIWLLNVKFGSPKDMYEWQLPFGLMAMVLGSVIRIFILRSTLYALICLIFTEIMVIIISILFAWEWVVTLSWNRIAAKIGEDMIFHLQTWNLVVGFVVGAFLVSCYQYLKEIKPPTVNSNEKNERRREKEWDDW